MRILKYMSNTPRYTTALIKNHRMTGISLLAYNIAGVFKHFLAINNIAISMQTLHIAYFSARRGLGLYQHTAWRSASTIRFFNLHSTAGTNCDTKFC